jgi:uncharacterized protein YjbI with pentapeptide repeats
VTELAADCGQCFALCCVGLTLTQSADFALDKPAGQPCPNLASDLRCGIHAQLRTTGFRGCTTYDCFGAGQRISQVTFAGQDWRSHPETADAMFSSFGVMRQLHELLFYLRDALERPPAAPLRVQLLALQAAVESVASGNPLVGVDVDAIRATVGVVLGEVSALVRDGLHGRELARADLIGKDFADADLCGAQLRGALLIGATLRGADLRLADLLGTDLRDADVSGADLSDALFLTQQQANAVRGDAMTRLPGSVQRPSHWS